MTADIDAISIVRNWLKENGYDGLFIDDCGCVLDDLQPCGKDFAWCKPGYIQRKTSAEKEDMCHDGDFIVGPVKPYMTAREELLQGDLYRIAKLLDIGARPYSGHEAMERDILPRLQDLIAENKRLRDAL